MAGNSTVGTTAKGKAPESPVVPTELPVDGEEEAIEKPRRPMDYKVPTPEPFNGDRSKLKSFLVKCELYFGFNHHKFTGELERVLWATTLLRGPAFDWMEAHVTDYMDNKGDDGTLTKEMETETITIFRTWGGFKKRISRVFGDIDQERNAVRHIRNLRQRTSAATYTAEFQQYANKTDWEEAALKDEFYQGLKDHVKDELSRAEWPKTLQGMIEAAIRIDNRAYERGMEKKGQYSNRSQKKGRRTSYWPQPMELDVTFKQGGRPQNTTKDRQFIERLCFNCDKPGHMARDCRLPKKNPGRKPPGKSRQLNATWKGRGGHNELAVTVVNKVDWDLVDEDIEEYGSLEYESLEEMEEIVQRRRSTRQLKSKN